MVAAQIPRSVEQKAKKQKGKKTKRKPQWHIALGLLRHVFDAPSIWLSLHKLRPRRARFCFTRQQKINTKQIFEHPSHAQKIPGVRGLAPDMSKANLKHEEMLSQCC